MGLELEFAAIVLIKGVAANNNTTFLRNGHIRVASPEILCTTHQSKITYLTNPKEPRCVEPCTNNHLYNTN